MISLAAVAFSLAVAWGCGAGQGTERLNPPGPATSAPPGDTVVFVSEGQGDRIAAYRLGTDGLMPEEPFSTIEVDNPRRLILRDDILYAALSDGVVSISINADGSFPPDISSTTTPVININPLDLELIGDFLYVAFEGIRSVSAYALEDGQVPPLAISLSGTNLSSYTALSSRGRFLYAAAANANRIDTYLVNDDGTLDPEPIPQSPQTRVSLPNDMVLLNGNLYIVSGDRRRIEQYDILNTGLLPRDPLTETKRIEFYSRILIVNDTIYATAFNAGRTDLYGIDPGTGAILTSKPFAKTFADVSAFTNGIMIENGILYVTLSGRDRIDAHILGADGVPATFPSSSTNAIAGSFPNDLVSGIYPAP